MITRDWTECKTTTLQSELGGDDTIVSVFINKLGEQTPTEDIKMTLDEFLDIMLENSLELGGQTEVRKDIKPNTYEVRHPGAYYRIKLV